MAKKADTKAAAAARGGRQRVAVRKRRAIGRPSADTEGVGREGLIEKTCELLRIMPPAKVTRAEVARFANVDPSLIRYYFKDRSALLVAATERITARFGRMMQELVQRSGNAPEAALRARVDAFMDLIVSYPFFHRLFVEELLATGSPDAEKLFRGLAMQGVRGYEAIIAEGKAKGSLREVPPEFLLIAIIGMTEFLVSGMPVLKVVRGDRLDTAKVAAEYREFVISILLDGLRAKGKRRKA